MIELVQVTTADGVRLDGALSLPTTIPESAVNVDAVLLVHGTGGSFYSSSLLAALAERFKASGVAVLRVNTRGHGLVSSIATPQGGRRGGAAYEVLDDCRHDLAAWVNLLNERGLKRVAMLGHSSGAIKVLYAQAKNPQPSVAAIVALSPPRLSYSWFNDSAAKPRFRAEYDRAQALAGAGEGQTLLDVKFPLPFLITAAGYLEKYGPDERYNVLKFAADINVPALVTFGSLEVESNIAFAELPQAMAELEPHADQRRVLTIPGGDHFYSQVTDVLCDDVVGWLRQLPAG